MLEVAIVGFASSTRKLANALPDSVEIWGLNNLYRPGFLKRADRWFELHSRSIWDTTLNARRGADYPQWLAAFGGPVYLLEQQPDIPNSVRYPIEEIVADVGDYLTSTAAYMLALAIHERVSVVHIYGIEMTSKSEYADQRAGFEYLLGLARGRGLSIVLPPSCPLLVAPLYGRGAQRAEGEHITDNQFARRLERLEARKAELEQSMASLPLDLAQLDGAIKETIFWMNTTPEGVSQEQHRQIVNTAPLVRTAAASPNGVLVP